jgi:hypothetical protein
MPHCNERENFGVDFAGRAEFRFVTEKGDVTNLVTPPSRLSGPVSEGVPS